MLRIVLVLLLSIPYYAYANPIRVEGMGLSVEQAKQDGFRKAVEFSVGSVVVTNREYAKQRQLVDEIVLAGAGYVTNHVVIQTRHVQPYVYITMDVYVADSRIADRIISKSKSDNRIDTQGLIDLSKSYNEQEEKIDNVIRSVMTSYPRHAFNITAEKSYVVQDNNRNMTMVIPYQIYWNNNFVKSFKEILEYSNNGNNYSPGYVRLIVNPWPATYRYNDLPRVQLFKELMSGDNDLRVKLDLYNRSGFKVYTTCQARKYTPGQILYALGEMNTITIYAKDVNYNTFNINLQLVMEAEIARFQVSVSSAKDCKNLPIS